MSSKIIFWIDGSLTSFCLAYYLQQKLDSDFFAIIESYEKPKNFFKNQKLVKFNKTWFYHDSFQEQKELDVKYLENFEKKYEIGLWELAINERIFYRFNRIYNFSDNEIKLILEQECRLFEKILTENKPDFVIMFESTLHQHELFYRLCKKIGVKPLILNQPNIGRSIISENSRKIDQKIEFDKIPCTNKSLNELREFRKSFGNYNTIKNYRYQFKTSNLELLKATFKFFTQKNRHIKTLYTHRGRTKFRVLLDETKLKIKRKIRFSFIEKNLEKKLPLNENFVYFPLGVDEERNLLIGAPFYTNQIEIIRSIAKSLPIGYKLYVKENPAQKIRFWRSISEYKEIINIPNVRLLHPDLPPENIFEKCSLVITVNGSSGLDAAFFGKPSIVFSDLGYAILPSVSKLNSIQELPKLILTSLEKNVESTSLEKYLKVLYENSFDFDPMNFENKYNEVFYYNGHYYDVDISESKMKSFLEENKKTLESLTNNYLKKLDIHKKLL